MDVNDAEKVTSRKAFTVVTILEMCLNFFNLLLVPYLFARLRRTKMIHTNLKAMLMSLSVGLGLFNVTRFWKCAMYLLVYAFSFVQSHVGFYNRQCWFNRFIYDTTMNLFAITMGAMACERIVATAAVRRYEQIESVTLSTTFVAAQWIVSLVTALCFELQDLFDMLETNWNSSEVQLTCSLIYTHPHVLLALFVIGCSGNFIFAVILFVLYKINMREFKRRAMNTLAARYQLAENITTLRFLIPLVLLYGALYGITLIFVVCIANKVKHDHAMTVADVIDYSLDEKMVNLPGTIYTTVYCCLCFVVHIPLRNKLKDDLRWISSNCIRQQYPEGVVGVHGGKLTFSDEGAIYFKALQNDWR